jgi:hypothetical protein
LLKTKLNINRTIEHKNEKFNVREAIILAAGRANVREILSFTARVANKDARLSNGRVTLSGELLVMVLYRGDSDDNLIEFLETELQFSVPVDISGARDDMIVDDILQVLDASAAVRPDADGEDRVLETDIVIGAQLKVYSMESMSILEDAYVINQKLTLSKTAVRYPRLVCRNRNQVPVKEVLSLSAGLPDMMQIFRVKGKTMLDSISVLEDKVVVEGAIETDILYLAQSDATPLCSHQDVMPFRQVIEAKGAHPKMRVGVDITIDHIAFSMLSGRETEVRFLLSFNTQVVEEEATKIISDILFAEMNAAELSAMASMTVYVVQSGDNLWRIAQRFNTSIDEMCAVNELDTSAKLTAGQKLLILKRGV